MNTIFVENMAGQDGLAIYSIGALVDNSSFALSNNTLYCPRGEYGYDKIADEVTRLL